MFALFPMGVPWRRKAGVSETANGDAAMVRSLIGSPVYRRSTRGAEVEVDRKSASSLAAVYIAGPFCSNVFFQKVCARMNNRAGTLRRSRLFGQLPGRNKLKIGSRLLVSPLPEIKFILSCCGVL
jgi:hypothetical protein